jgi:hypothetical protein
VDKTNHEMICVKELTRFRRWADHNRRGRGLLCHFYERDSKKQYYTDSGYAYFNLFSDLSDWIIKGTTNHGIRSEREKTCQTPVLNCYQIDEKFYEALEEHCNDASKKYEFGVILSKKELRHHFGEENVANIELWGFKERKPPPSECWRYDVWSGRKRLWPFNNCNVVRVRITRSRLYGMPIKTIPSAAIMALLVKTEGFEEKAMSKLLKQKRWKDVEIFPLL